MAAAHTHTHTQGFRQYIALWLAAKHSRKGRSSRGLRGGMTGSVQPHLPPNRTHQLASSAHTRISQQCIKRRAVLPLAATAPVSAGINPSEGSVAQGAPALLLQLQAQRLDALAVGVAVALAHPRRRPADERRESQRVMNQVMYQLACGTAGTLAHTCKADHTAPSGVLSNESKSSHATRRRKQQPSCCTAPTALEAAK